MASSLQQRVESQPVLFSRGSTQKIHTYMNSYTKVWQQPYVNVFKQMGIFDGHHAKLQGDVKVILDPTLNKQVLCIKGSVSAANFIELPGPGTTHRERTRNPAAARVTSLGLTGEYMYLQIRAMTDRFFAIHIDVLTTQGLTIRLSISNIFKYIKLMNHGRVLQLPCDFLSTKWTVLALHFPSLLEECSNNVQSMNAFAENNQLDPSVVTAAGTNGAIKYSYANIQRVQFCSNLYVKNMITSNHKYSISTFPKEVKFFVGKNYTFDDFYEFFWIITPPSKAQQLEAAAKREESLLVDVEEARAEAQALLNSQGDSKPIEDVRSQSLAPLDASQRLFEQAKNKHGQISPAKHSVPVSVAPFANQTISPHKPITPAAPNPHSIAAASFERVVGSELTAEEQASRARFQPLTTAEFDEDPEENKRDEAAPLGSEETEFSQSSRIKSQLANSHYTAQDSVEQEEEFDPRFNDTTLVPDPILGLEKIIGYSASRTSKNLVWSPDGQYMIYPSNNILIISHVKTGQQEFLTGHTACINVVAMSSNGILATGQEGKQPLIRLWDFQKRTCVGILMAHNSDLRCLAFSYLNLMLGAVGRDAQGRILIVIWDISSLLENGKIHIVAKQLSDFGINRLLFSPFREDPMHLISCGHESIRFWRIKTKHLPGSSLQLNEHARNTFTDIAFESKYGDADQTTKRMFVSTASGSLFQINYATRQLECIYKLHSGPIYSISINEGFCVTGSGDSFLRVWPLDFSDYFLQAQHKGAITSVQISTDGLHVLVGSENGCIGVLDLGSTAYQTRIRSHLDTIYQVAFDPHRDEFCTVSKDGTIRIFGTYSLEQIYEFYSPHEIIHCVAYHPLASEYRIACGFASGSMRIMDIATTTMHVDYQQHTGRILDVVFSHDGLFLYSNGEDGNICAYDCSKQYLPVRMFTTYRHQPVPLPPSVSRTLAAEAERSAAIGKSAERIKTEHEGRSPFLSHHLDRARQEEKESQLAPGVRLPHHSHSHARHCDPNGHIGASIAPAGPHSHGSQREAGPKPLPPHALAINDDGSLLATIGADPTSIVILSTDTLRQIRLLSTCAAPVARLHFAQASRELAVVLTDASFMRFNVDSGSLITHVQPSPSMRFKQERALAGKQTLDSLAFAAAASGVPSLNGGVTATSSTISPLNLYLLTGSNEGLLRVWDFHSKTHAPHFQSFTAHQNPYVPQEGITSIMFSPDGKRLITTGGDSIWIWNVKADEKQALNDLKRRNHRRAIEQTRVPHSHHSIVPHSALALSFGQRVQPTMMQQLDPTVSSAGSSFRHAPSAPAVDHHPQQQPRGSSMHEVAVESHQPAYNPSVYETGSSSSTTAAVAPSSVPRSAWAENPSGSNAAAPRL